MISGWVCDADTVEIEIGTGRQAAAYGTERADTLSLCVGIRTTALAYSSTGICWGTASIRWWPGWMEELGRATVRVTTLGQEFLRGAEGACMVEDFPDARGDGDLGMATE